MSRESNNKSGNLRPGDYQPRPFTALDQASALGLAQAEMRAFDTNAPLNLKTDPASHRLTLPEAQDRATLLALFDKLDTRGQRTTLAMLAVAVKLHPRS